MALLIITFSIVISNTNRCFALSDVTNSTWWSEWNPSVEYDGDVLDKIGVVLGAVRVFGIVISVVTLVIIGIKIMLGSVEEKANYKQTLRPWVIGATMVFAITVIPSTIYDMTKGVLPNSTSQSNNQFVNEAFYRVKGYDDAMAYYKNNIDMPDSKMQEDARKIRPEYGAGYMNAINTLLQYSDAVEMQHSQGGSTSTYIDNFRKIMAIDSCTVARFCEDGTITKENIAENYITHLDKLNKTAKRNYTKEEEYSRITDEAYIKRLRIQMDYFGADVLVEYATWRQYKNGYEAAIEAAKTGAQKEIELIDSYGSAYWKGYIRGVKIAKHQYAETTDRFSVRRVG